ncbi:hypothetical protein N1I81_11855 [Bacillus sp. FSL M8-0052]|uniref:hypothetical protein n=1 Tax=Bacillus TaxID=1386 RepID=UPI00128E0D49|nr:MULTISPECIES: hypothetical protein [Bacillus]
MYKIRSWIENTMVLRYHLTPLVMGVIVFFILKTISPASDFLPLFLFSCIPSGWHTFNYIKGVLIYREMDATDRLIAYFESRKKNFSLSIQLLKWGIKAMVAFFIGIPSVIYLIYKISQDVKRLYRSENRKTHS